MSYPRVPLLDFIPAFPPPLDIVVLLAFAIALGVLVWCPQMKRLGLLWFVAAVFLALQDQSRLEPWFIEYLLLLFAVFFSRDNSAAFSGCRMILAAVYFWSGVHKMNTSFATKLFPWLVSPVLKLDSESMIQVVGAAVPFLEIGMAVALLFPKTRRIGVIAIVVMHLFLLAVLGPWSLDWNNVVMPWNVAMIVLVPVLFWESKASSKALFAWSGSNWAYRAILVFVLVLPPLSLAGLWDTSPSFALYSGNQLIGSVVLSSEAWEHQDSQTRSAAEHIGNRYRLRIDDWSVLAMNVPAYPAERVLRRIAQSFCAAARSEDDVIFILEQPPRWFYRAGWHRIENSRELCR